MSMRDRNVLIKQYTAPTTSLKQTCRHIALMGSVVDSHPPRAQQPLVGQGLRIIEASR